MSENLNSNNIEEDEFNLNTEDSDYQDLITKLKDIKSTITLLEKTIFKKLEMLDLCFCQLFFLTD